MNTFFQILLVGLGGALGALSRFGISEGFRAWVKHPFPLGTLIANLLGCFLIGILIGSGVADKHHPTRLSVGIGFLGALTTFSTFGAETMSHFEKQEWGWAFGNIVANLVLGLLLVAVGIWVGRKLNS